MFFCLYFLHLSGTDKGEHYKKNCLFFVFVFSFQGQILQQGENPIANTLADFSSTTSIHYTNQGGHLGHACKDFWEQISNRSSKHSHSILISNEMNKKILRSSGKVPWTKNDSSSSHSLEAQILQGNRMWERVSFPKSQSFRGTEMDRPSALTEPLE